MKWVRKSKFFNNFKTHFSVPQTHLERVLITIKIDFEGTFWIFFTTFFREKYHLNLKTNIEKPWKERKEICIFMYTIYTYTYNSRFQNEKWALIFHVMHTLKSIIVHFAKKNKFTESVSLCYGLWLWLNICVSIVVAHDHIFNSCWE